MPPVRRPFTASESPSVEDLSTFEKASQTAMYLAERIEAIKQSHSTLKKRERTGTLSPVEVDERINFITSNLNWLIADVESYATKIGVNVEVMEGLRRIERVARKAEASPKYGDRIWGRDYRIVKQTAYSQGWLYEHNFLFQIAPPETDFTELLRSAMIEEARNARPIQRVPRRDTEELDDGIDELGEDDDDADSAA